MERRGFVDGAKRWGQTVLSARRSGERQRASEFVDGAKRRGQTALSARRSESVAFAEGMVAALGQSGQSPSFRSLRQGLVNGAGIMVAAALGRRRGLEFVDGAKRWGQTALSARRSVDVAFAEGMVAALGQSSQSPSFRSLRHG